MCQLSVSGPTLAVCEWHHWILPEYKRYIKTEIGRCDRDFFLTAACEMFVDVLFCDFMFLQFLFLVGLRAAVKHDGKAFGSVWRL